VKDSLIDTLTEQNHTKIVFLILDGVGGLHLGDGTQTELETARTPNLDSLARRSSNGLIIPVAPGVTPGSGPAHFALFGYDPVEANIGRGVLEAAGIGFQLTDRDVAVRGNFATVDSQGRITDRRAGRISTEENKRICEKLRREINIDEVELFIEPVKEHRVLLVLRGDGLGGAVSDTDPQATSVQPLEPQAQDPASQKTAQIMKHFLDQVRKVLADEPQANMITLRGFAKHQPYPTMQERYGLRSLCIANYPMYRGVAFLVGMDIHPVTPDASSQLDALEKNFTNYDFHFVHLKSTDKAGEDGDFNAKVRAIEEIDGLLPRVTALQPDVLVVTGDHSTPSALRSHSWHPVPVLLYSKYSRLDEATRLTEKECLKGALGQFSSKDLMALALAHSLRLKKFGA